jgi:hypothetical protein
VSVLSGEPDSSRRDGPRAASGGDRRPILIAALRLALFVAGAVAYFYADDVIELASSLTSSPAIHAQGHIRY